MLYCNIAIARGSWINEKISIGYIRAGIGNQRLLRKFRIIYRRIFRCCGSAAGGTAKQIRILGRQQSVAATEQVETADIEEPETAPANEIEVSVPRIAYTYDYSYRLGRDEIGDVQSKHADYCEKQGQTVCRIINMSQSSGEGDYSYGQLEMQVAADQARSFVGELTEIASDGGGEKINGNVTGEDLSKKIVDTEARLRARTVLRDRLMEVLRSRKGTVAELVEAERGVAQVNEEIDQARSWLEEMKGRVAFSKVTVGYTTGTRSGGGFIDPIRSSFSSFGSIIGGTLGAMITFIAFTLPWILLIVAGIWLWRRFGRKAKFGAQDSYIEENSVPQEGDEANRTNAAE